ncbi:MAG: T9SS type A sorting domain-containing protein [Candidatus Kryptoniota bacterium]
MAQRLDHSLTLKHNTSPIVFVAGTVNVLAVMVQFQTETDSLISGNGHLLMSQGSGLDAPPHDKTYFENHLLFLKNYIRKVSGGNSDINYTVLDSVVTLPHQMKYYSPPKTGGGNNLGLLFQDSWHTADSLYGGTFPFDQYQCFVIFHAGSGRDIDFTTELGYDPLPYNIPSIYLDSLSLENMSGVNHSGELVDNGNFLIQNSIIMPESETYPIVSLTLGTNGLLAASFGSFLGLPDLFDTQTGVTGIGRFGLMDGQAIFAYGGIFPPEPSAWEKMYLGWVTPVKVSPSALTKYQLYANETGKYSVLKVPINATEYFLLENREGDAHHDGEIITSFYNGSFDTTRMNFISDTAYFDGQQIKEINGVVTDADEYDWALPQDTTYFGGILIWHIDQSVIDQNIATNTINANPDHRGVALMEAIGANEIGNFIQSVFGSYYYDGSPYDFWYSGNPDRSQTQNVGGNQFSPTTLPNSDSYSGANSNIYITKFSNHDSLMTFDIAADSIAANFQVTVGFPKNIYGVTVNSSPAFGHISADGKLQVIANNGDSLYAFNMDGTSAGFDSTGFFSKVGGKFQPVVSSANVNDTLYAMDDSVFYGLVDQDNNHDGTADTIFTVKALSLFPPAAAPLLSMGGKVIMFPNLSGAFSIFTSSGKYIASSIPLPAQSNAASEVASAASAILPQFAAADTNNFYLNIPGYGIHSINLDNLFQSPSSMPVFSPLPGSVLPVVSISYASLSSATQPEVVELTSQSVYLDSTGGSPWKIFSTFPSDTITSGPVIADLDGDGNRDVIFATQTKIYAVSHTGAVLNHFPISTVGSEVLSSDANKIVGSIVVAALNGDTADVIFGTKGGTLYAFNGVTGQVVLGFPLSIGGGLAGSPALAYDSQSGNLYLDAIGLDGFLYSWTFAEGTGKGNYSANSTLWGNLLHDNYHMNSITGPLPSRIVQLPADTLTLMPKSKVYNWPNPVINGTTKIHFYLNHDAQVSISIFSFAGNKVTDIPTINGTGGIANEVDWNVSGVQSGVYFARVEAVSSKEQDVVIIKIAVVK